MTDRREPPKDCPGPLDTASLQELLEEVQSRTKVFCFSGLVQDEQTGSVGAKFGFRCGFTKDYGEPIDMVALACNLLNYCAEMAVKSGASEDSVADVMEELLGDPDGDDDDYGDEPWTR